MADSIVHKFRDNSEFVKIVVLPAAVFIFDLVARFFLHVSLIDAGADMALLGVSMFIAIIIEDSHKDDRALSAILTLMIVLLWLGCLLIVSLNSLTILSPITSYDFKGVVCWFLGLMAFMLSSIFADSLIRNARPDNQGTNL